MTGAYRQRVTIEPVNGRGRPSIVHASHLVPFEEPYVEPQMVELGTEGEVEPHSPRAPRTGAAKAASKLKVFTSLLADGSAQRERIDRGP